MKYKVLSVNTQGIAINIGDYIQALASKQFLPAFDGFINREALNVYYDEPTKIIMNGWYMHKPENWPPTSCIIPLFVAFHVNKTTNNKMFTEKGIAYLKNHEPIGCRDYYTLENLRSLDIRAYFSGCMTLTLGEKYHSSKKDNKCYFVDPVIGISWNIFRLLKNIPSYLFHKKDIDYLASKFNFDYGGIKKKCVIVSFYKEYLKFFTRQTIMSAEYIHHESFKYNEEYKTDMDLLLEAERLIKKYARAKLVVTSRIHCALPCVGLETPVVFIDNKNQSKDSSCRLDGLRELFNVLTWNNNHLNSDIKITRRFDIFNVPQNKDSWRTIADNLKRSVFDFVKED